MRWSSAKGYLHANNFTSRANFDVLINTSVTKILFASTPSRGEQVAVGVEMAASPTGKVTSPPVEVYLFWMCT